MYELLLPMFDAARKVVSRQLTLRQKATGIRILLLSYFDKTFLYIVVLSIYIMFMIFIKLLKLIKTLSGILFVANCRYENLEMKL